MMDALNKKDSSSSSPRKRYGLIAGWGDYPLILARAIKNAGHDVVCLGALGHADPKLAEICDVFQYMGLAKFGAACRYFRKHGVTEATMAGKIFKKRLFQRGFIWRQCPDLYTISVFFPLFLSKKTDMKNDTLLLAATRAFENKGVRLLPGSDLAPDILIPRGLLTETPVSPSDWPDIQKVWPLAREIGRLDCGQAVAIQDQKILAIEGIDGTDDTMARAARQAAHPGFTVIKIGKPNQDMRFDVPTIGFGTLRKMAEVGVKVFVIEADKTICIDSPKELIQFADDHKIAIVALDEKDRENNLLPSDLPCLKGRFSKMGEIQK